MYKRQDLRDGQVLTEKNLRVLEDGIEMNNVRINCLNHYGNVDTEPTNSDYFDYSTYNGYVIINGLNSSAPVLSDVVIPYGINGIPVREISAKVFKNNQDIKSVTIPRSINNIGGEAFMGCINLDTITALGNVSYIGSDVFTGCSDNLEIICHQGSYIDDYAKNNNIKCGYADIANEPSDWEQEDNTKINFIKNKPPIKKRDNNTTVINSDVLVMGDVTVANSNRNGKLMTETDVNSKIAELVNSAPEALDTLDELAKALGDDPNFATTVLNRLSHKMERAEYSIMMMLASKWSNSVYSFESDYPNAEYDIDIYLDGDNVTTVQKSAYGAAEIVGSLNSNTVKAFGEIPTIDIPIIIKAVKK